jgi:putative ABC transport system permease protein
MFVLRLLLRNAFRHRLRTALTVLGLVVAVCAYGLLRTVIDAWYAGAEASSSTRLVTRSAISLTVPMPLSYAERIRALDGVRGVSWANWFGGIYVTERNFFAQFAVDPPTYLALYPEYRLSEAERQAFFRDQQGAVVGRKLAEKFGWKIGDQIPLRGTIYPGTWTFTLRGIYEGAEVGTDEQQMLFHWKRLSEALRQRTGAGSDRVGVFVIGIADPDAAAAIPQRVPPQFRNSLAETLTETEKAFQLGFVAMSEAILLAIRTVSGIVIVIIMVVMANTMTMTARERLAEYATLKALGFPGAFVVRLLFGESLLIAGLGGALGIAASFPAVRLVGQLTGTLFPVFRLSPTTLALQVAASVAIGLVAAAWPAWRTSRLGIVNGLRHVG